MVLDRESFLRALFSESGHYIEIRTIDKEKQVSGRSFFKLNDAIAYDPPQDQNIYFGVFNRKSKYGGKATDCLRTQVLWADFDDMELEEIIYRIEMSKLPIPSIIVHSGNGYHCYWLLDKPYGHEVQPIVSTLAKKLAADTKATDVPRIMRLPGTTNIKDGTKKVCKIVRSDLRLRNDLRIFEKLLGVKAQLISKERTGAIKELLEIKWNGLNNMANGVSKGERNFCVGRITQTLKRLNYTKQETKGILFRWNELNRPVKSDRELKKEFETFWNIDDLKFNGKEFSDDRLQELNYRFIDKDTTFFKADETESHHYDNELLHPEKFKKMSGLTFAVLSIVKLAESEGIRREHIADICRRSKTDKKLATVLSVMEKMNYITKKRSGRAYHYYYKEKPNFDRGFTSVPILLHKLFLAGELKEHEYKMLILLESYAFDGKKDIFPSNAHLAFRTGQTERNIRYTLKHLEHRQYIAIDVKVGKRWLRIKYR